VKKRLLITARDAAAALHLIEVAKVARARDDLVLEIVTQFPAAKFFQSADIPVTTIDLPAGKHADTEEAKALLAEADRLLSKFQPDSILCGLSTPFDAGIDEAILASFKGPSFVMQDFWGEANLILGRPADIYLSLDEEGVRLSRERHGLEAEIVGSPRHSAYRKLDLQRERIFTRARLGADDGQTVIGFFGQGLHHLDGYRRTVREWASAVNQFGSSCIPVYRPHPRESDDDCQWTCNTLREMGLDARMSEEKDVEHALLGCDVVCSAFSNCTYDVAYLNYFSGQPLITPLSLFFDEEIIAYFRKMVRLSEFPYLKAGLVEEVKKVGDLAESLRSAAQPQTKLRYWQAAQRLHSPIAAPGKVLERVLQGHTSC